MVCGGFTCSKNALAALNVLYFIVALILIGVAAYSRVVSIVVSLSLVGGVIASGVFLMLIAVIGYVGAIKHHQVLLFFYMVILFLLFLFQFSMACLCLAVNDSQRSYLAQQAWIAASNESLATVQTKYNCCGFADPTIAPYHPTCEKLTCCSNSTIIKDPACGNPFVPLPVKERSVCSPCLVEMKENIRDAFSLTGGIGLFFSFTEIIGVWITIRYRNQKDPRANPSSFL